MSRINTMEEFSETVKATFVATFPGRKIDIASVTKNNGLCLTGVTVRPHSTEVVPTIYLEPYFADLQSGSPLPVIIDNMISNYKAALEEAANTSAVEIYNFDSIKHKIIYRLVNKKLNYRLLADMPHRDFMDLAICYCVQLESTDDNVKTIKITDSLATGAWKADEETLWRLASENTPRLNRGQVIPMDNIFGEIMGLPSSSTDEEIEQYDGFDITLGSGNGLPVYIVTNERKISGASVILYNGLLDTLAEKLGSFYLLPSAIHEIIIFPGTLEDAESMLEMVKTVNTETVSADEILSDNCFYYNATTHSLKLITQ